MYAFSTPAFFFILALASSMAVVQAGEPRVVCLQQDPIPVGITTCDKLAQTFGKTNETLTLLNSGQTCEQILHFGFVCIHGHFPTCMTKVTAGGKDCKCDGLAAANHISIDEFIRYNDDVDANDCSGVVPGQKYCVAIKPED